MVLTITNTVFSDDLTLARVHAKAWYRQVHAAKRKKKGNGVATSNSTVDTARD